MTSSKFNWLPTWVGLEPAPIHMDLIGVERESPRVHLGLIHSVLHPRLRPAGTSLDHGTVGPDQITLVVSSATSGSWSSWPNVVAGATIPPYEGERSLRRRAVRDRLSDQDRMVPRGRLRH